MRKGTKALSDLETASILYENSKGINSSLLTFRVNKFKTRTEEDRHSIENIHSTGRDDESDCKAERRDRNYVNSTITKLVVSWIRVQTNSLLNSIRGLTNQKHIRNRWRS